MPAYKFAKFVEKLPEIKKILVRGGGGRRTPLDPPLISIRIVVWSESFPKTPGMDLGMTLLRVEENRNPAKSKYSQSTHT